MESVNRYYSVNSSLFRYGLGMAILYALVARASVVDDGQFHCAPDPAENPWKRRHQRFVFPGSLYFPCQTHRWTHRCCMADDTAGRRIPFEFLEDIHQKFVRTYGRAVLSAQAYAMNDEFSRVLGQQMDFYSNDPNADRINRLRGEMSQVRNVMIDNIDKVLDRGDRLAAGR